MRAEVRKFIEFSLPQAQVIYISLRNKFILVKTTNLSLSSFIPSCTPISSWPDNDNKYTGTQISTWRLDMSRTAANHVEEQFDDHSDDKIQ